MIPLSQMIQQILIEEGFGGPAGTGALWPVFANFLPDNDEIPVNAICVYDTVGTKEGRNLSTGEIYERPGLQVKVRAQKYTEAYSKLSDIALFLDLLRKRAVTVNTTVCTVNSLSRSSPLLPLGQDPKARNSYSFTANFTATTTQQ